MRALKTTAWLVLTAAALWLGFLWLKSGDAGKVEAKCKARCLTLHGTKGADYMLGFTVLYVTTLRTSDCTVQDPRSQMTVPKRKLAHFAVRKAGQKFSIDIPLDTVSEGTCDWKATTLYLDVASLENKDVPVRGGRSLLTFVSGEATVKTIDMDCRRVAIHDSRKSPEVRYSCAEARLTPPLRLGDGSHVVEMTFFNQ